MATWRGAVDLSGREKACECGVRLRELSLVRGAGGVGGGLRDGGSVAAGALDDEVSAEAVLSLDVGWSVDAGSGVSCSAS